MKTVTVHFTWRTSEEFEVEDDWTVPDTLDGFKEEDLDWVTSQNAELVDWE